MAIAIGMSDKAADLPNRPMTLRELCDFYVPLQAYLQENVPGSKKASLRLGSQRQLREGFHAYMFGFAYGSLFGCIDTMTIHVIEDVDYDVLLEWKNGGKTEKMRLQLKELVGPLVNPKAAPAEDELAKRLNELVTQYPKATDLTVAIYLNYPASYGEVKMPKGLQLAGLWVFGWTKPKSEELFIAGGVRGEHRFFIPWAKHT